ncbi:MAG: hypothetical protein ACJ73D_02400 [Pyrinomonadaceae bacterium]
MSSPPKSKGHVDRVESPQPRRHLATKSELDLLELSRRHLSSIKMEIDAGTSVDPAMVGELERGIADLESAYNEGRDVRSA